MKMRFNAGKSDLFRLSGTLFALTLVVSLLLGVVNEMTKDKIAANTLGEMGIAMRAMTSPSAEFSEIKLPEDHPGINRVYEISDGGAYAGVFVDLTVAGSQGSIGLIVGVTAENTLLGVSVTEHAETPNLGARITEPDWLGQFVGQSSPLTVTTKPASAPGEISAISGATVSSAAVTQGVETALGFAAQYNQEVK